MITYYRSEKASIGVVEEENVRPGDWVRSERPNANDIITLHEFGIDSDILTDALDPHEVPRIEHDDGWTYFITRVPDVGDDFNDFTTPIMFALNKEQTITVSRDLLGRLWQPFIDANRAVTTNQSQLFLSMVEAILQSYQKRVAAINRQMRSVTSDVQRLRPSDIAVIVEYERKLNDYLDALIPTNVALEKTLNPRFKLIRLTEYDQDLVEDLSVDIEQVIARCKSLLRTITNVRDSFRAVMDTRLNETMRILTVATLGLTIPTMLAGLMGMNVDFPFNTHGATAFWVIVGASITIAIAVNYYFLRRR